VKVAFLVNDLQLSGGIGVVVAHARQLHDRHGFDVTLVLAREQEEPHWAHDALPGLHVATLEHARGTHFDVAVSTWWETAFVLFDLRAERYASFVQSLEDRFYRADEIERLGAQIVLDLPVAFITEARWIRDTLGDLRPDATCHLVRNGIDKATFPSPEAVEPNTSAPLRILVEGYASSWFKGVNTAIAAVRQMREPHVLTVVAPSDAGLDARGADRVLGAIPQRDLAALYGETDVVLKLSQVEGMYGPPLEGFHMGATCVTTEVTGHEEYVEHGYNALICDWDDERGTARQLDLLARNRRLLHALRSNALQTARTWPTWEQSGEFMAGALHAIRGAPPPPPGAGAARLLADVRAGMEAVRMEYQRRDALQRSLQRWESLRRLPGIRQALAVHGSPGVQVVLKALHPITRRVKQRLLGPG
jgi:O-antigen biosynthesis protein